MMSERHPKPKTWNRCLVTMQNDSLERTMDVIERCSSVATMLILFVALLLAGVCAQDLKQTNLLMIMFDDLRPELSVYGRQYMITPNFERLASKSVVFDYAFCQVAVCNPSRDSLMTGLRPDTVGTYNFGHSWSPHLALPQQLVRSGYNTAGIGKIFHWETTDRNVWSFDAWDNRWYDYQGAERARMNASIMPDKNLPEEKFRDSLFVDRALSTWARMIKEPKPFMLALGFKLPHLAVHVPFKYYDMYKGRQKQWKLTKKELRFPPSTTEISYRCCAEGQYEYVREDGAKKYNRSVPIGDINGHFPEDAHMEMMHGYVAGITFLDTLLGRLWDFMDTNGLWETTTVVLTSDHGMHNGEKNIWEKWTLFEEATRVPLIIHHPLSPYNGQHYKLPVELVDVYATLNEILRLPITRERACSGATCKPLSGKSLAPVILGKTLYEKHFGSEKFGIVYKLSSLFNQVTSGLRGSGQHAVATVDPAAGAGQTNANAMPVLEHNFALSQVVRCAPKQSIKQAIEARAKAAETHKEREVHRYHRHHFWNDCDMDKLRTARAQSEEVVLGYAMRTPEYRYVCYFYFNRTTELPILDTPPFVEELYDHKNETLQDFTHRETFNLAIRPSYATVIQSLRTRLVDYIRSNIQFGNH